MGFNSRAVLGALATLLFVLAVPAADGIIGSTPALMPHSAKADTVDKQSASYRGKSKNGQPISFQLVRKGSRARVTNLAVDVVTECWADQNMDGVQDKVVAHITELGGSVSSEGEVDVYFAPDDDTEYVVEGTITGAKAKLNVIVGGRFGPDGTPNAGSLDCDNWGTRYKAKQRR